jgi:hypothetical protein
MFGACEGTDSRWGKMFTEKREEGRDKVGKGCGTDTIERKKTKQKRQDRFTFNVRHGFEARTPIGAPGKTRGRADQIIRRDSCPPYPERAPFGSATFWGGGKRRV